MLQEENEQQEQQEEEANKAGPYEASRSEDDSTDSKADPTFSSNSAHKGSTNTGARPSWPAGRGKGLPAVKHPRPEHKTYCMKKIKQEANKSQSCSGCDSILTDEEGR